MNSDVFEQLKKLYRQVSTSKEKDTILKQINELNSEPMDGEMIIDDKMMMNEDGEEMMNDEGEEMINDEVEEMINDEVEEEAT